MGTNISNGQRWAWRGGITIFLWWIVYGPVAAQWNFLGGQLISDDPVTSQSLAVSPAWHPHVAYTSGGQVKVERFDGSNWVDLGSTNLPPSGIQGCAIAFSSTEAVYLALAPNLDVFKYDGTNWQSLTNVPAITNVQGLQMRFSILGKLWLSWYKPADDTTYVVAEVAPGNWAVKGKLPGQVLDMELDDFGQPLVLIEGDTLIHRYAGGIWQTLPTFTHLNEAYVGFQMLYDGTGTGSMVLRRDSLNQLSVESLSFGNWVQMGNAGFAAGDQADLGLSLSGIAHVVSVDNASNDPPRAYSFVAGNWQLLGGQVVYNNTVSQPQLAFDPNAVYVVFRDDEQDLRNSVMYLGTPSDREVGRSMEMRLWPNPVLDELHVMLQEPVGQGWVRIMDGMGRLVQENAVRGERQFVLEVGDLPAGPYFILLYRQHRPMLRGSFIKQD